MISDTVILGCLIWFPLIIWVVSLVQWMVIGEIDPSSGIIGIVLGIGLGYTAMKPPVPILSPISFTLVVGTVVLYPFLRSSMDRHDQRNLDVEAVDKAYQMIGQRPDSPFAKFRLAQSIYRLGMIGHAVAIADSAMAYVSERTATEEHRILKRWKAAGVPPETMRQVACIECHTMCQPGWTHCRTCGRPFLLDRAKGRILPEGLAKRMLCFWGALVLMGVGVPCATALPVGLAVPVIVAVLAGGFGLVLLALKANDPGAH